jgi:hypothetical protein
VDDLIRKNIAYTNFDGKKYSFDIRLVSKSRHNKIRPGNKLGVNNRSSIECHQNNFDSSKLELGLENASYLALKKISGRGLQNGHWNKYMGGGVGQTAKNVGSSGKLMLVDHRNWNGGEAGKQKTYQSH